ncbi:MAG: DUF2892 domain-containing protein [Burkholderiales bacterium]
MNMNIGKMDRIVRVVLGIALLLVVLFAEGPMRWWGLIGIVPLATAFSGWCPAYLIFGMNTCGTKTT